MRAILHEQYGGPECLRLGEAPRPVPGPGQVLVRVEATSLHADVWHVVAGVPYVARPAMGLRRPRRPIPGTDLAGEVVELGPGVVDLAIGDAVYGEVINGMQWTNGGAFAEYACARADHLALRPPHLTAVEAAAIPTSALIALLNVQEARVKAGETVLVNGAAGGVGVFVVQILLAMGARVVAVDAADRLPLLRQLGADAVIDYRDHDYTEGSVRYDAVIDIPGNRSFAQVRRVLAPQGRYVLIGHDAYSRTARPWLGSIPRVLGLVARAPFTPHLPLPRFPSAYPQAWQRLTAWVEEGKVRSVVGRTFPLDQASEALTYLMSGEAQGKVVLVV